MQLNGINDMIKPNCFPKAAVDIDKDGTEFNYILL